MGANDPRRVASLDPRVLIGRIHAGGGGWGGGGGGGGGALNYCYILNI